LSKDGLVAEILKRHDEEPSRDDIVRTSYSGTAATLDAEVSRMKRWFPFLFFATGALLGCTGIQPPLPPLSTPVASGPRDYRVAPVRWQENTVLTYDMVDFQETRVGDHVKTSEDRHVFQMRAVARSSQGVVRVRFALDGTEFGQVRFDDQGRVMDATPTNPAHVPLFRAMVQLAGSAALREYASTTFRQGEPVRVNLPAASFAQALPPEFRSGLAESVPIDLTYMGQVRVGDSVAAVVNTKAANLLRNPICGTAPDGTTPVCLAEFRLEGTEYRDPTNGHLVAEYSIGTATGSRDGRPLWVWTITRKTLDHRQSAGW